jgi:hypothetical protein
MPAAKRPYGTARPMPILRFGKNMFLNKVEHLMKYWIILCNNPFFLVYSFGCAIFIVSSCWSLRPLYFLFTR